MLLSSSPSSLSVSLFPLHSQSFSFARYDWPILLLMIMIALCTGPHRKLHVVDGILLQLQRGQGENCLPVPITSRSQQGKCQQYSPLLKRRQRSSYYPAPCSSASRSWTGRCSPVSSLFLFMGNELPQTQASTISFLHADKIGSKVRFPGQVLLKSSSLFGSREFWESAFCRSTSFIPKLRNAAKPPHCSQQYCHVCLSEQGWSNDSFFLRLLIID